MMTKVLWIGFLISTVLYLTRNVFGQFYISMYDTTVQFYLTRLHPLFYDDEDKQELSCFLAENQASATPINSTTFKQTTIINAQRDRKNEYCILALDEALRYNFLQKIASGEDRAGNVSRLLRYILPHVSVDGARVEQHRCIIVDLLTSTGGYFPSMHTDVEWSVFDASDGFQTWILLENSLKTGNMFILDSEDVLPASVISSFGWTGGKPVTIKAQCGGEVLATHKELRGELKYLDMRPGECLLFGKNLYHCSDLRPSSQRMSLNFRVVIADRDGGVPVNLSGVCAYSFRMRMRILGIPMENGRIFPKAMQFLQL
jgi:hypothetical protein